MDCKFSNLTELTVNVCYFSDDIFPNMKMGYLEQQKDQKHMSQRYDLIWTAPEGRQKFLRIELFIVMN